MTVTVYHEGTYLLGYEAEVLPPVDHLLTMGNAIYVVIRTRSTIVDGTRRSSVPTEKSICVDVILHSVNPAK